MLNSEQECTIINCQYSEEDIVKRILSAVVLDHSEIIHYSGLSLVPIIGNGDSFTIRREYSNVVYTLFQTRLDRMIDEIERQLPANASDYLVCKAIFNALAARIKYDNDVLSKFLKIDKLYQENSKNYDTKRLAFILKYGADFTPYGILINSKGEIRCYYDGNVLNDEQL